MKLSDIAAANIDREVVVVGLPEYGTGARFMRNGDRARIVGFRKAHRGDAILVNLDAGGGPRIHIPAAFVELVDAPVRSTTDVKARDLAHAHEKVAEAYKALAYALNDLKAVEAR